jgi:hypothetical protein
MITPCARRAIFKSTRPGTNGLKQPHHDMRDAYHYKAQFERNEDVALFKNFAKSKLKDHIVTWTAATLFIGGLLYQRRKILTLFELDYIESQPVRDYDEEDYDYKFFELPLAITHPKFGTLVDTEKLVKENYVLVYLGELGVNNLVM